MQIFLGSDYHGFDRKSSLLRYFATETDYNVTDLGTFNSEEICDYNDPAIAVAKSVRENSGSFGILICDSAHGMTIQANRFKGIRAAYCPTMDSAKLAREHDDANVICLAAHFTTDVDAINIVKTFLSTDFTPLERRIKRINKLDEEDYAY